MRFGSAAGGLAALASLFVDEPGPRVDPAVPSHRSAGVAGEVRLVGPGWLTRPVKALADGFMRLEPRARVRVETLPDGDAARPLSAIVPGLIRFDEFLPGPELRRFEGERGRRPLTMHLAAGHYDRTDGPTAVGVFVHMDNPLEKLTLAQLDAIFSKDRERGYADDITRWGQLGLKGEWADHPISLYGRQPGHHVWVFFRERVLKGSEHKPTYQGKVPSKAVVDSLLADRYGIGYVALSRRTPGLKPIALAESVKAPYVAPVADAVVAGKYPLIRYLCAFVERAPAGPLDPSVKAFLKFALSREGQEAAVKQGYLPLPVHTIEQERARVE